MEDAKITESRISYIAVSSQTRNISPFKVVQTHLELQDYEAIQLDDWTEMAKYDLFSLSELTVLPYEKPDNTWVSVTVEMDLNRIDYSRSRYTVFDLLSDVGGLSGIFFSVFSIFMLAWNHNALENFMVAQLFKVQIPDQVSRRLKRRE